MKDLATPKLAVRLKKPSHVLGFVFVVAVCATVTFYVWQFRLESGHEWKLKPEHQIAASGVVVAVIGVLIAGWLSIHNSIRQHTIATLLDSRLSETYMRYADILSRHYSDYEKRRAVNPALRENPTDKVDVLALRYILNYFEFIAIGVKRGDFDEETLRDSLRSILRKNVTMSMAWIRLEQSGNARLYTNLLWLYHRWATT